MRSIKNNQFLTFSKGSGYDDMRRIARTRRFAEVKIKQKQPQNIKIIFENQEITTGHDVSHYAQIWTSEVTCHKLI